MILIFAAVLHGQQAPTTASSGSSPAARAITEADCTAAKLCTEIPVNAIGEPVSAVTLNAPHWHAETNGTPAYCSVEGSLAPVDRNAPPIHFGVALPASWSFRGAQLGGGGMNGLIPRLTGGVGRGGPTLLHQGFATYGSDSGHQMAGFSMPGRGMGMPGGAPRGAGPGGAIPAGFGAPNADADGWALNNEAVANLGYMQLKKTHDAAMVVIQRAYGARPRYNYFVGSSLREAATRSRWRSATPAITTASQPRSR